MRKNLLEEALIKRARCASYSRVDKRKTTSLPKGGSRQPSHSSVGKEQETQGEKK